MTDEEIGVMAILLVVGRHKEGATTAKIAEAFGVESRNDNRICNLQVRLRKLMEEGYLICRASKPKSQGGNGQVVWLPGRLFPAGYRKPVQPKVR